MQSSVPAHERLYKMNEYYVKKKLLDQRHRYEKAIPKPRPDSRGRDASTRLYKESMTMQQEGKLMRKKIEDKFRARAPTPTRSISLKKARGIYERGQTAVREKELKIQMLRNAPRKSSFPKMRTQTPTRNRERYYESREGEGEGTSTRSSSRAQSRSQTPSRARYSSPNTNRVRNQTPSRSRPGDELKKSNQRSQSRNQTRSRTSSRQRERSQTPSRRMSQSRVPTLSAPKIKVGSPEPKLPPSFKISQTE